EQLEIEQRQLANDLHGFVDQSNPIRDAVQAAGVAQARDLARQARDLGRAQRELSQAEERRRLGEELSRLADLAAKQELLAKDANRLAEKTMQAAQVALTQPLRPEDAAKAAQALRRQDTKEALKRQEQALRELERLGAGLDRGRDRAGNPREAARQLSRLQEGLWQQSKEIGATSA